MLDTSELERLVKEQITSTVNDQVLTVLTSDDWLKPLEQKILKYTQDRILSKFANSSTMPEIVEAVKTSVNNLFSQGLIPGIDQYVDHNSIKQSVNLAVEQLIQSSINQLAQDPVWLEKVEKQINQTVAQQTISRIGSIDINTIIHQRVDENMKEVRKQILTNFTSTGIVDQATSCQLTIMDENTVVENQLTTQSLDVVGSAVIRDLVVKGSINTDNQSWSTLVESIAEKTLSKVDNVWRDQIVENTVARIEDKGINFNEVTVGGEKFVNGNKLSSAITDTLIQSVGMLRTLTVKGEASFNNTTYVLNKRLGINTAEPEMALSIWDEEVSIVIGKHKAKQAYIGTNRDQGVAIGVNRIPQIELEPTGLTKIKQLQIGLHKIGHAIQAPGWSGTKGDLVFNTNPTSDRVFGWVCLGAYNWQTLKSAE